MRKRMPGCRLASIRPLSGRALRQPRVSEQADKPVTLTQLNIDACISVAAEPELNQCAEVRELPQAEAD